MTPDETSRDLDHLEAEVARLKTVLAGMGSRAVPQQPRLGLIKMWAAGMNIRNGKVKTPRRKKKPPINGYASALMGFDFADAETLRLARREFAQYLERNGMDRETAEAEAAELNRSWEFATYAFCPTGEGGGIDNSCSPTGETGISERGSKSLLPESHAETNAWIDIRAKDRSISRNEFLTTDEYKAAYPYLQQLYRAEKLKTAATAVKAMAEVKVNFEDRVGYDYVTPFGVEPYKGEIISRNGIPYIKLDEGQTTIKGTRSVRWHKGWKKLSSGKSFMLRYMSPWRGLMDLRPGSPNLKIFGKYVELRERKREYSCNHCGLAHYHSYGGCADFAFCPTGEGGGVDPTCSPAGRTGGGESSQKGGIFRSEGEKRWRTPGGFVDKATQSRLEALKVPPAWKDVKLSSDPKADLQVTGIDKKGRKQAIYSVEHSERASAEKFARLKEFTQELPQLRQKIEADINNKSIPPHEREAAAVLSLIDKTGFRIGSDRETGADKTAFGASTLKANHVKIDGDKVQFSFTGKKGVRINKTVHDEHLASILKGRVKTRGRLFDVTDGQVRDYLRSRDGEFKVKDFRTWKGTAVAIREIQKMKPPAEGKPFLKAQRMVARKVARELGNTPTVALKSYIDPAAWSHWKVAYVK